MISLTEQTTEKTTENTTAFINAAKNNNIEELKNIIVEIKNNSALLQEVVLANYAEGFCGAAECGHTEVVKEILAAIKGNSALLQLVLMANNAQGFHWSARFGHKEVVEIILAAIKDYPELLQLVLMANNAQGFNCAARKGHTAVVKEILAAIKDKPDLLKLVVQAKPATYFHWVCRDFPIEVVNEILAAIEDHLDLLTVIFEYAAEEGNTTVVQLILEAIKNKHNGSLSDVAKDNYAKGFLLAASEGHTELVEVILKEIGNNQELLKFLIMYKDAEVLRSSVVGLKVKKEEVSKKIFEAIKDKSDVLKAIIHSNAAYAAAVFRWAAAGGHKEVVKEILAEIKDTPELLQSVVMAKNAEGFCGAARNGHTEVIKAILDAMSHDEINYNRLIIKHFYYLPQDIKESLSEKAKNSIYLGVYFYENHFRENKDGNKDNFFQESSEEVKNLINFCCRTDNAIDKENISSILANINHLLVFDNIIKDNHLRNMIKNSHKKGVMKELFSNNSILSWAIDHLNEAIDNVINLRSAVESVIIPWVKKVTAPNYLVLEDDFNNKAFSVLKYFAMTMQAPSVWLKLKNWIFKVLARVGLKDPNTIEKTDVECFEILIIKFATSYNAQNIADFNTKITTLRNLAREHRNTFYTAELNRIFPSQQNDDVQTLDWLANNRESAMRALSSSEPEQVNILHSQDKYKSPGADGLFVTHSRKIEQAEGSSELRTHLTQQALINF